ncbi:hypothetical protein MY5147_001053 [Beauveria neobassiana]
MAIDIQFFLHLFMDAGKHIKDDHATSSSPGKYITISPRMPGILALGSRLQ